MGLFNKLCKMFGGSPAERPAASGVFRPQEAEPEMVSDEIPEITGDELKEQQANGQSPVLLDIRPPHVYQMAHLVGAINIPLSTLPQRLAELDREADIVVYCDHGFTSLDGAAFLLQNGFSKVRSLAGGITEWHSNGGAVASDFPGAKL